MKVKLPFGVVSRQVGINDHPTKSDVMLRFFLALCFVTACAFSAFAQKPQPIFDSYHKNIFLELGGSSILTGVHYDQRLRRGQMNGLGFRAGIGGLSVSGTTDQGEEVRFGLATFPLEVNVTTGRRRSGFVAGAGLLPVYAGASVESVNNGNTTLSTAEGFGLAGGYLKLGYRLQPLRNGVFFEFNYNPLILRGGGYQQYFGLAVGVGFK